MYYVSKHAFLRLGQKWGQPLFLGVGNKKLATRKRLGMHVLLIDVVERNSEKKIRSILGKEKENRS
jgi:hypothetical protein